MSAPEAVGEAGDEQREGLGRHAAELAAMGGQAERRAQGMPTVGEFYGGLVGDIQNEALAGRVDWMAQSQDARILSHPDAPYDPARRFQPPETEANARAQMALVVSTVDGALQGVQDKPSLTVTFDDRDPFKVDLRRQVDLLLGIGTEPVARPGFEMGVMTARYSSLLPGLQVDVWSQQESGPEGKMADIRYTLVPLVRRPERVA